MENFEHTDRNVVCGTHTPNIQLQGRVVQDSGNMPLVECDSGTEISFKFYKGSESDLYMSTKIQFILAADHLGCEFRSRFDRGFFITVLNNVCI